MDIMTYSCTSVNNYTILILNIRKEVWINRKPALLVNLNN